MLASLIIGLLIASIFIVSIGFLLVALRLGKHFDQLGNQPSQGPHSRRHTETRR